MLDLKSQLKQDGAALRLVALRYHLNWTSWNISQTAKRLRVSRQTIHNWINEFKLKRPKTR